MFSVKKCHFQLKQLWVSGLLDSTYIAQKVVYIYLSCIQLHVIAEGFFSRFLPLFHVHGCDVEGFIVEPSCCITQF